MLKTGNYKCRVDYCGRDAGEITLFVKETAQHFVLELIENTVRYDAPQIDDMFREKNVVKINKGGSKHAMTFSGDNWFCLYPYRVGVPYPFDFVESEEGTR